MKRHKPLQIRPGREVVYQIFPDRWRNARPELNPRPGQWSWKGRPIQISSDPTILTANPSNQYTFYGGDLPGVTASLDYLSDLGVTAVYLNPIFAAHSTHRYDAIDFLRIDSALGTREDFETLSAALRQRGMKLILDGVFNHTSEDHPWHTELRLRRQHYIMQDGEKAMSWMGGGSLPKLDTQKPEVVKAILKIIAAWPEADGWRLDAAHLLPEDLLKKIRRAVLPRRVIVEDWNFCRHYFTRGLCDGSTNFLFRDAVRTYFREDASPETLLERIKTWIDLYPPSATAFSWNFLDNHDTGRFLSTVGRDRTMRALVLLFTLPGTPMLYHGDEVGLTGRSEGEARAPMIWDHARWDMGLHDHTRMLIHLRHDHPCLALGKFKPLYADNRTRTFAYERRGSGGRAVVAMNDGYLPSRFTAGGYPLALNPGEWRILISDRKGRTVVPAPPKKRR